MQPEITWAVREAVAETLDQDVHRVPVDAAIVADLGAESIELVDILFRIECTLGVRLAFDDVGALLQGALDDNVFLDAWGRLAAAGRDQLAGVLSASTAARIQAGLRPDQVSALLTVHDLAGVLRSVLTVAGGARHA